MGILLSIAFFTLVERKIIGLSHYRKGPNKVVLSGISQPIADASKLLTKEYPKNSIVKQNLILIGPILRIFMILTSWAWFEFSFNVVSNRIKIVLLFATIGLGVYRLIAIGWGSNRKYSILGGHRAVAQTLSYEVCLFLFIVALSFIWKSFRRVNRLAIQQGLWPLAIIVPLFLVWVLICLAEANRTPFDTAEGESEIVSGFNIEYGGGLFALIFIREYGIIMILRFITVLYFGGTENLLLKIITIIVVLVWTRCSFPRVRYDQLILLAWKLALPFSLVAIILRIVSQCRI